MGGQIELQTAPSVRRNHCLARSPVAWTPKALGIRLGVHSVLVILFADVSSQFYLGADVNAGFG